jgi:hypothetical protein
VLGYSGLASDPLVEGAPKIEIVGTSTVDRLGGFVESKAEWTTSRHLERMLWSMALAHTAGNPTTEERFYGVESSWRSESFFQRDNCN